MSVVSESSQVRPWGYHGADLERFHCPRCGGDHPSYVVEERRFASPIVVGPVVFPFWALCPAAGEPLLLMARRDEIAQVDDADRRRRGEIWARLVADFHAAVAAEQHALLRASKEE